MLSLVTGRRGVFGVMDATLTNEPLEAVVLIRIKEAEEMDPIP